MYPGENHLFAIQDLARVAFPLTSGGSWKISHAMNLDFHSQNYPDSMPCPQAAESLTEG